jgi:hypothetical protein
MIWVLLFFESASLHGPPLQYGCVLQEKNFGVKRPGAVNESISFLDRNHIRTPYETVDGADKS